MVLCVVDQPKAQCRQAHAGGNRRLPNASRSARLGLPGTAVDPALCSQSGTAMISPKDKPKKRPPKDSITLLPCFYFVELPIVASSMASLYFLELTDVLQPARSGFHCHDRALSMPYVDGGEELIPLLMLLSLAFAGPAASIMLGEGLLYCLQSRLKTRPRAEGSINAGGCNFNSFLRRTVRFVGVQIFGLLSTALVTDVMQLATGFHTPFFLTVCKPNYTSPGVSCERNPYITRDICSGRDQHAILAARKSFPSQHATLSAFAAVYISIYFNSSISDSTRLLKPALVLVFSMAAALTGLTQVTQHRSHPVDVYAGFLIGAAIGARLCQGALYAVANFRSSPEPAAAPRPPPAQQPPRRDALRALTQRGHDSLYHKPAGAEGGRGGAEGRSRQARREKASLGSVKRASADVELLAPRGIMGKETMVTFSNTLPRAHCPALAPPDDPARRPLTFLAPPPRSLRPLVFEWGQSSLELPAAEGGARGSDAGSGGGSGGRPEEDWGATPSPLYPITMPTRPVAMPLVHLPEGAVMSPPPVSPKSATTRARWLSMTEQGGASAGGGASGGGASGGGASAGGGAPGGVAVVPGPVRPPAQPRVAQVIAMSKHESRAPASPRSSETASSSRASSSSSNDSVCCRAPGVTSVSPAPSVAEPAQEPLPPPPPSEGHARHHALQDPPAERAGSLERALLHKSANQL
ncbi:hypothetical protein AAFF_G00298130 [Aldrovandia affinis]|uniref:Phospholipid phosphatase-related protein type 3 n=1 Tax=Aldrovandia affinis TaxID=143900 RepID=A0AAD7R8Q4_9TELE|nr:hypothetical protein AAFF_G00298130 [Aldrovandia affinis]